jgi:hypothetical protein
MDGFITVSKQEFMYSSNCFISRILMVSIVSSLVSTSWPGLVSQMRDTTYGLMISQRYCLAIEKPHLSILPCQVSVSLYVKSIDYTCSGLS